MSKRTLRKSLDYVKKDYVETRKMPGNWYLSSYQYKFNITHHQPFLKKLKDKKLVGNKCSACNRVFFPPRLVCGKCLIKPDQWVDLRDTGQVSTYTIVYLKDPETGDVLEKPVVMVQQDNCDTNFMAELQPDIDFKDTYIGMPIKVHWTESTSGNLKDIEYYDLLEDDSKDLEVSED
jgi:uncharacterized OB-fold protein